MDATSVTGWFSPTGILRTFNLAEIRILEFMLTSGGLSDVETVSSQLRRAIVHEIEPGRYCELLVVSPCDIVSSRWTGLYVNAFAPISETEGVEALLHLSEGLVSALEFCYSPDVQLLRLPELDKWIHL